MQIFAKGDRVVRKSHQQDTTWMSKCGEAGLGPGALLTVETCSACGLKVAELMETWATDYFRLATGLEVQQGVALPAEDHIVEKESHVECLRNLLDGEKAKVEYLTNQVQELQAQLDLAKTMVAESNDQRDAAVAAAKGFGEDIMAMKRNARHERYEAQIEAMAAVRILRALASGVDDLDLYDLANQLGHISRICDEQGNGADAKLCGEAASALSIAARAVTDWRAI